MRGQSIRGGAIAGLVGHKVIGYIDIELGYTLTLAELFSCCGGVFYIYQLKYIKTNI